MSYQRLPIFSRAASAALILSISSLVHAQQVPPLTVYDNFEDNMINNDDWIGGIVHSTVNEMRRQQSRGKLITGLRGFSDRSEDTRQKARNSLFIDETKAAGIHTLNFKAAVHRANISRCVNGGTTNRVKLRTGGYFFNTGGAAYCGDRTGDVFAQVWIGRHESSNLNKRLLNVSGGVKVCLDAGCNQAETKYYKNFGVIKKDKAVNLTVHWDDANASFVFRYKKDTYVFNYDGVLVNAGPPSGPYAKGIQTTADVENCEARNGREPYGIVYGSVDIMRVNADYAAMAAAQTPRCAVTANN